MYAVIKSGGKQYRVKTGDKLKIDKLDRTVGEAIVFDQVLAYDDNGQVSFGTPTIDNAKVHAEVIEQGKHDKVTIFKLGRRKHYQKRQGHRQEYTAVQIGEINV